MWVPFNPNPLKKSVGDCVVRVLCKVLERGWVYVFIMLCIECLVQFDMPSSNAVWGTVLKHNSFRKHLIPDSCPDCYTIRDFAQDHPYGIYAVGTGSHVVAIVDGDYFDSWDSGSETVTFYWRKEL